MSALPKSLAAAALLLALGACGDAPERAREDATVADDTAAPAWVVGLAEVADAIEALPAAADSVLATHDMTRGVFDSLMYEVASNAELTAAYQEARRR
ncbi:MAG: hypothetical protein ACYC6F_02430 [Longimicrobiales bacterium]